MDLSFVLFAVVAFLAVVMKLEGAYTAGASGSSPEARRIATRIEALASEPSAPASIERSRQQSRMPRLDALLGGFPAGQRMQHFVIASAMAVSAVELIMMSAALGAFGLFLPALLGKPPIFGAVLGLGLAVLP